MIQILYGVKPEGGKIISTNIVQIENLVKKDMVDLTGT